MAFNANSLEVRCVNESTLWVPLLKVDDFVWLCREGKMAIVVWPFDRARGMIGISVYENDRSLTNQNWYVRSNGCGMDGTTIMQPTERCSFWNNTIFREYDREYERDYSE
tara:strand:+ start:624 stop:953 length:330 start_codon:yes stop_codon:yes gene_type:complete